MIFLYIILLILMILVVLFIFTGKNDMLSQFKDRQELSLSEIYNQYFSTADISRDVFEELWKELSSWLEINPSLLRPDDAFNKDLAPEKGNEWDHPVGLMPDMIQTKFKKAGLTLPDLSQVHTVRDYILLVAKAVNGNRRRKCESC